MPTKVVNSSPEAITLPEPLERYLSESRRPLTSLAFVVPLLLLYEGGVIFLGPSAVRNGADVWLRQSLDMLGFSQYFLLPALTVGLLLAWHHVTRDRWQLAPSVVCLMFLESAIFGLLLVAVARIEGMVAASALQGSVPVESPVIQGLTMSVPWMATGSVAMLGRMIGYMGAGVYEEMLFRLLLVPPLASTIKLLGVSRVACIAGVVLFTSVVFSAAHYVGPHGEVFDAYTFGFRFTAGIFFALQFVFRGFGIAAGTHALYDIFVSLA